MTLNKEDLQKKFGKNLIINENLSKYSWFNLGGPADIFFRPENKNQLINFLTEIKDNNYKVHILGAGSNTLIRDSGVKGVVIKLSSKFADIKLLAKDTIEVGASILDRKVSDFAKNNDISGMEFLSCIPGSIGGAIIMNSGCYGDEISSILHSVKTIDYQGVEKEFKRGEIQLFYRGTNLPKDLIIISAKFKGKKKSREEILNKMQEYIEKKKNSQPSKIKTCGSTFKNPKDKKAWELIKDSNCELVSFGKASISKKHCNFFVNEGGASSEDIERLIKFVREKVFEKHKVKLDLELKIIGGKLKND